VAIPPLSPIPAGIMFVFRSAQSFSVLLCCPLIPNMMFPSLTDFGEHLHSGHSAKCGQVNLQKVSSILFTILTIHFVEDQW
jgi:hypothetical protein